MQLITITFESNSCIRSAISNFYTFVYINNKFSYNIINIEFFIINFFFFSKIILPSGLILTKTLSFPIYLTTSPTLLADSYKATISSLNSLTFLN